MKAGPPVPESLRPAPQRSQKSCKKTTIIENSSHGVTASSLTEKVTPAGKRYLKEFLRIWRLRASQPPWRRRNLTTRMGGGHSAEHVEKTYAGGALVFGLTLIGIVVFFVGSYFVVS